MEYAVRLRNVGKTFSRETGRLTAFKMVSRHFRGHQGPVAVEALRQLSFDIPRGDMVGVVGNNGAGKTTLLKTIAGLYTADAGEIGVTGRITFLAGLGIGMVEELTVEENVFLYAAIYGIDRAVLKKKLREIIEWADLGEFENMRMGALSTGMRARLAFSVTRHISSDVYLVDEALSAGDKNFVEKCEVCFRDYRALGKTFIVSTHNLEFVRRFCSSALWLDRGQLMAHGEVDPVLAKYSSSIR